MKKTVFLWILRYLLIPVGFIWATGIFSFMADFSNKPSYQDPHTVFSNKEIATLKITPENLRSFGDSLAKERESHIAKTGFYEPHLYFGDLKQYSMFEVLFKDSLNKTFEGRAKFFFINHGKDRLMRLRDENWRHAENIDKISNGSITEAVHFWFPKVAEEDARKAKEPPIQYWPDFILPTLLWFFGFYLKGIPFAFCLLLIWRFRFNEQADEEFRWEKREKPQLDTGFAPLSFLLSLLLWPLILWIDIRNRLSDSMVKAEVLSRRKDMLSAFSKQDKKLEQLGRQMSRRDFRLHLDSLGMRRRHSFVSALFVVFFFISIQRTFPCQTREFLGSGTTVTIIFSVDADIGWTYDFSDNSFHYATLLWVGWPGKVVKAKSIFSSRSIKALAGYLRTIEGVPKVSN